MIGAKKPVIPFLQNIRRWFPWLLELKTFIETYTRNTALPMRCPVCEKISKFRTFGLPPRINAVCANCGSRERHRLQILFLQRNIDLFRSKDVLHFAPERIIRTHVESYAWKYTGCDINPTGDQIKVDIEKIFFSDKSFDTILCSHVLEHVDDRKALLEIFRILKPGGVVLLMFPIIEGWKTTFEDKNIESRRDRLRYFGQEDHVRYYGRDVRERIKDAGFILQEYTAVEPEVSTFGLLRGEKIFIAQRP